MIAFYDDLMQRLRYLPRTVAAGAIVNLPLGAGGMNGDFAVQGVTFPPNQEPLAEKYIITPDYFHAMGVRLLRGRFFTEQDGRGGANVIIVGESVARKFWPKQNPIGKRVDMQLGDRKGWQEIVGVVPDVRKDGLDMAAGFELYVPFVQVPTDGMDLTIRSTADPGTLAAAVRAQVLAIDREQPVYGIRTMQQVVADSLSGRRMSQGCWPHSQAWRCCWRRSASTAWSRTGCRSGRARWVFAQRWARTPLRSCGSCWDAACW